MKHPSRRDYYPRVYEGVQRRKDYERIADAVARSGGEILWSSPTDVAPWYLAVQAPDGTIHGVVAYVFFANAKKTKNRPTDEHRTQLRYGDINDPKWRAKRHGVAFDPTGVDLTLVVAVHPEADLLITLDPLLYDPLPIGISIFFKDEHVDAARKSGWHVWERDNVSGVRRTQPRSAIGVETLVACSPNRFFDLVRLEREAQALALDSPLRFQAAERIGKLRAQSRQSSAPRTQPIALVGLEAEYDLAAQELLEIIQERSRLAMAVRGGVAEHHAGKALRADRAVSKATIGHQEGPPDYFVKLKKGGSLTVEVKNAARDTYKDGTPKVEVQKTRASKGDPLSRLYKPEAFDVLAACMYGPHRKWEFRYQLSSELTPHPKHLDRIAPMQRIDGAWASSLGALLRRAS